MNKEHLIMIAKAGLIIGVGYELSSFAFSYKIRRELGEANKWTCTWPGCDDGTGQPKSFQRGWMVFASHKQSHDKTSANYDKASIGTIFCIEHEIANHQRLLHLAQQHHDTDQIRFNVAALNKLKQVDWRTVDYRKNPQKYGN